MQPPLLAQKAALAAGFARDLKLTNAWLGHTGCGQSTPEGPGEPPLSAAPTGVHGARRLCVWHSKTCAFKLNSMRASEKKGFPKLSFANLAFWSAGRAFSWVGWARAVGFGCAGLPGRSAGRPDGRQLRRQWKCGFRGILEAAGRKRFYANGEPLTPHL